jgi:CheY-like chemotaxis protein
LVGVPVLIVEDDPLSAKLTSIVLASEGAIVRIATSAEEALDTLREFLPRLIVLDLVLPRMGGLLFAKAVKADDRHRDAFIVAVTAINGPETRRIAEESGCDGYVRKPIETETFARTLAIYLGNKR